MRLKTYANSRTFLSRLGEKQAPAGAGPAPDSRLAGRILRRLGQTPEGVALDALAGDLGVDPDALMETVYLMRKEDLLAFDQAGNELVVQLADAEHSR